MTEYELAVIEKLTEIALTEKVTLFVLSVLLVYFLVHNMLKRR